MPIRYPRALLYFVVGCRLEGCSSSRAREPAPPPVEYTPARDAGTGAALDSAPLIQNVAGAAALQPLAEEELARAVSEWQPAQAFVLILEGDTLVAKAGWDHGQPSPELPLTHTYVTGSTLKPFTVAIALDEQVVALDDTFDCRTRSYPEGKLSDASPHKTISLTDVIVVSSNVGTSRIEDRLGPERLQRGLAGFGFHCAFPNVRPVTLRDGLFASGELYAATPLEVAKAYAPLLASSSPSATAVAASILRGAGKAAALPNREVISKTSTAVLGDGTRYASFIGTITGSPLRDPRRPGSPPRRHRSHRGGAGIAPLAARLPPPAP